MNNLLDDFFLQVNKLSTLKDTESLKKQFIQLIQKHLPNHTIHWINNSEESGISKVQVSTPDNHFGYIIIKNEQIPNSTLEDIWKSAQIIAQLLEKALIKRDKENKTNKELLEAKERAEKNEAKSRVEKRNQADMGK